MTSLFKIQSFNVTQKFKIIILCAIFLLLVACDDDDDNDRVSAPSVGSSSISLEVSPSPITLNNDQVSYARDVSYASDAEQSFDIFMPSSEEPTPVVIYIHGGSFSSGDKSDVYSSDNIYGDWQGSGTVDEQINFYMDNGIAFINMNYRLLRQDGVDDQGVIKSLRDVQRCLQYIRYHSATLNIDKTRVVLHGLSAGAGSALWLAFNDELADTDSVDVVARESTRVSAVVGQETQATYDLISWISGGVFEPYFGFFGILFPQPLLELVLFAVPSFSEQILSFFAVATVDEIFTQEGQEYRANIDMLALMSDDDPEVWISNVEEPEVFPTNRTLFFHHPYHARILKNRAAQTGLNGKFYIPQLEELDSSGERLNEFVLRKLKP